MPQSLVSGPQSPVELPVSSFHFSAITLANRVTGLFSVFLFLVAASFASDLKVKVVDPQSAVVAGARVAVYPQNSTTAISVRTTNADGACVLTGLTASEYRLQVLAPGFAPATAAVSLAQKAETTVKLPLPKAAETVVVSAERTPQPAEETGTETA